MAVGEDTVARLANDAHVVPWTARLHAPSASALYVHLPFCVRKCAYCDFASWETPRGDEAMSRYVDALCSQLKEARDAGLLDACETAYVGGGTPTMLGTADLARLVRTMRDVAPYLRELTCEANPDSLDDGVLRTLAEAGVTRLSIGVQSLQDGELAALGRLHDAQRAEQRVAAAVASGLDVSLDLMCATPLQTDANWADTLRRAIDLGVGHISVYPLQIEEGTPLAVRLGDDDPDWNDPAVQAHRMEMAEELLTAAGLARYEVASYARPGKACRHNQAYWTGLPYLGLGTGASSMLTAEGYEELRRRWGRLPRRPDDAARVRLTISSARTEVAQHGDLASLDADVEFLTESQAAAEDLMLAMRMARGADPALLLHAQHALGTDAVDEAIAWCLERKLASWQGERLAPTHEGWLLGNELYGALWDLADGEPTSAQTTE